MNTMVAWSIKNPFQGSNCIDKLKEKVLHNNFKKEKNASFAAKISLTILSNVKECFTFKTLPKIKM